MPKLTLAPPLTLTTLADQMIKVERGTFMMGGESWDTDSEPIHEVQLDTFYLCRYPVNQQLWYEVMEKTPDELYFQHPHKPVESVSWDDITNKFLPALREKTGIPDYCLPTEAQWEYAARGGKYRPSHPESLSIADQDFTFAGSEALNEVAWYDANSFHETQPAGLKRPNALGLYDMSGNLWEWCQDRYSGDYYQSLVAQFGNQPAGNPVGPETGSSRVVRGGSWINNADYTRVALRSGYGPNNRNDVVGFRLCRYSAR